MVRRKIGDKWKIGYEGEIFIKEAEVNRQMADHFYKLAIQHHEKSLRNMNNFWRKTRQNNRLPKTAYLQYHANTYEVEVLKDIKDYDPNAALEYKVLQLEVKRLEKIVGGKKPKAK